MSKKIMPLALAAVTAAMFAVPATTSATLVPLHVNNATTANVAGGAAILRSSKGNITCDKVTGKVTPEAGGTTGTMTLTFGPNCIRDGNPNQPCTSINPAEPAKSISTTPLPYHLVTLDAHGGQATGSNGLKGVLVTPSANGAFAHFICHVFGIPFAFAIGGNGLLGTITAPNCGVASTQSTVSFQAAGGTTTQTHRFTHGATTSTTTGPWSLSVSGQPASQEATVTLTNANGTASTLVCT